MALDCYEYSYLASKRTTERDFYWFYYGNYSCSLSCFIIIIKLIAVICWLVVRMRTCEAVNVTTEAEGAAAAVLQWGSLLKLDLNDFLCSLAFTERRWLLTEDVTTAQLCCKYSSIWQFSVVRSWSTLFLFVCFFTVHACGGSKDVQYISLASLVRWSWLTLFSACFARIVFLGEVQHRLHYEHDEIVLYGLIMSCSAVLWS